LPLIYLTSVLNFFSQELGHAVLKPGEVFDQKTCLLLFFLGESCGDFLCGAVTQFWRSRRKTLIAFLLSGALVSFFFLEVGSYTKFTATSIYILYFALGLADAIILIQMITGEHFGTNVRATAITVTANIMKGSAIPMIFAFQALRSVMNITHAAALIGALLYVIAFLASRHLRETHGVDLDYVEEYEK
jgi:hypothetical protein